MYKTGSLIREVDTTEIQEACINAWKSDFSRQIQAASVYLIGGGVAIADVLNKTSNDEEYLSYKNYLTSIMDNIDVIDVISCHFVPTAHEEVPAELKKLIKSAPNFDLGDSKIITKDEIAIVITILKMLGYVDLISSAYFLESVTEAKIPMDAFNAALEKLGSKIRANSSVNIFQLLAVELMLSERFKEFKGNIENVSNQLVGNKMIRVIVESIATKLSDDYFMLLDGDRVDIVHAMSSGDNISKSFVNMQSDGRVIPLANIFLAFHGSNMSVDKHVLFDVLSVVLSPSIQDSVNKNRHLLENNE